MEIKTEVKNRERYNKVLQRLVFDAKNSSPEGDELEVLRILIDKYEMKNFLSAQIPLMELNLWSRSKMGYKMI
jgi:HTH-type transcriptional regulator/antitoxin HigA